MLKKGLCCFLILSLWVLPAAVSNGSAPDGSLYFNPEGGQYLHADSCCPGVSDAYWPLEALSGSKSGLVLTPCPVCMDGERAQDAPAQDAYFNPQGGQYFHADARCSSVSSSFLPLERIPAQDPHSAPYEALMPCPCCVENLSDNAE